MKTCWLPAIFILLSLTSFETVNGQQSSDLRVQAFLYPGARIHTPYPFVVNPVVTAGHDTTRPAFVHPRISALYSGNPAVLEPASVAPDYYYQNCYGIFCKMEWITQNQWHIPVAIRLGTYHYERSLEGEE